jgi:hypothetical protein
LTALCWRWWPAPPAIAERNGQPLTAKQIIHTQIGVTDFRNESVIISAPQRLAVRKLIQDLGLTIKNGEEAGHPGRLRLPTRQPRPAGRASSRSPPWRPPRPADTERNGNS